MLAERVPTILFLHRLPPQHAQFAAPHRILQQRQRLLDKGGGGIGQGNQIGADRFQPLRAHTGGDHG